jgi:hypothetical protein
MLLCSCCRARFMAQPSSRTVRYSANVGGRCATWRSRCSRRTEMSASRVNLTTSSSVTFGSARVALAAASSASAVSRAAFSTAASSTGSWSTSRPTRVRNTSTNSKTRRPSTSLLSIATRAFRPCRVGLATTGNPISALSAAIPIPFNYHSVPSSRDANLRPNRWRRQPETGGQSVG